MRNDQFKYARKLYKYYEYSRVCLRVPACVQSGIFVYNIEMVWHTAF